MVIITLAQSSYIEVNQIFGYLAPINHFSVPLSVKNVKQLCDKSHWFPKGKGSDNRTVRWVSIGDFTT